jgi:prepilin-type N-terminal cleavage/methylation domain-containing protein
MKATGQGGFTLAELLVVQAILATILTAVLLLQQQGQSLYMMHAARVESQQSARFALDRIVGELRSASAVTAIAATDLAFVDQSGATTLRYRLTSTDLERIENGVATVLIAGVRTLTFTYSDVNGATTATPGLVATVAVSLTAMPEATTGTSVWQRQRPMTVQDRIRLRNVL